MSYYEKPYIINMASLYLHNLSQMSILHNLSISLLL